MIPQKPTIKAVLLIELRQRKNESQNDIHQVWQGLMCYFDKCCLGRTT